MRELAQWLAAIAIVGLSMVIVIRACDRADGSRTLIDQTKTSVIER